MAVKAAGYLPFAQRLADAAGMVLKRAFRRPLRLERDEFGALTAAPIAEASQVMRALIEATYPEHKFNFAVDGLAQDDGALTWFCNPLLGIERFLTGQPGFALAVALCQGQTPILGLLDLPISRERLLTADHLPTTFNNQAVLVRSGHEVEQTIVVHDGSARLPEGHGLSVVSKEAVLGGHVALGLIDAYLQQDAAQALRLALTPIIGNARGIITDVNGKPITAQQTGGVLACGDSALHERLLAGGSALPDQSA